MDTNLIGAHEAAELLRVSVATIKRLAATGTLPAAGKPSGAWVFNRADVLTYAATRGAA